MQKGGEKKNQRVTEDVAQEWYLIQIPLFYFFAKNHIINNGGVIMTKEHVLSLNNFKEPKILAGKEAIATLLVRLLLLNPGTFPDRPTMGVGLVKNWRYSDKDSISDLRTEISKQIGTFLPKFQGVEVNVELTKQNTLVIGIVVDDTLYKYELNEQSDNDINLTSLIE